MNEEMNANASFNKVATVLTIIASIIIILEAGYKTGQWLYTVIN